MEFWDDEPADEEGVCIECGADMRETWFQINGAIHAGWECPKCGAVEVIDED